VVLNETVELNKVPTDMDAKEGNGNTEQSLKTAMPTEASRGPNTKENRSLEEHKKANNAASDDRNKGTTLTKENTKVGRNDEEEYILDDDINQDVDVREHDETNDIDDIYKDDEENQHWTFPTSSKKYVTVKNPDSTRKKCDVLINTLCNEGGLIGF
jgi:GH18 family chitinase